MNHLAHIYLSGNDEGLIIGNYIADYIRGNKFNQFPEAIQKGVQLHRAIDTYTDNHPVVRKTTKLVMPVLGKFSGVAADIYFDYFLANRWNNFHADKLENFAKNTYSTINNNWNHIPEKGRRFYGYMVTNDLLVNYRKKDTLRMVFNGIDSKTKFESNLPEAVNQLNLFHHEIEQHFEEFFSDLIDFVNFKK